MRKKKKEGKIPLSYCAFFNNSSFAFAQLFVFYVLCFMFYVLCFMLNSSRSR